MTVAPSHSPTGSRLTCPAMRRCLTFCLVSSWADWKCFSQVPYSEASRKPRMPAEGTNTWNKKIRQTL